MIRHALHLLSFGLLLTLSSSLFALESLDDQGLSDVSGTGIAFALDDFSSRMAPTSYIEMTGSPMSATGGSAASQAAYAIGWRQGDLRYYGLSMTGGSGGALTSGTDWYGDGCVAGSDGLGCPIGYDVSNTANPYGSKDFASVYNPYMIRVFQNAGYNYDGSACLGSVIAGACTGITAASPTVYEFIGPSKGDAWRWSFWGQLRIDNGASWLKSQSIILGKNATLDGKPSKLQILQTPTNTASEQSLSVVYQSRLSGNFRFSVQQKTTGTDGINVVPNFDDAEGLYFKNVNAFLPLGQLNYQTVVFRSTPSQDGNFIVDLTPIANNANVYNSFYCGKNTCTNSSYQGGVSGTGCTRCTNAFITTDTVIDPTTSNPDTHGYVYWGTSTGAAPVEGSTDTTNGIYFKSGPGGAIPNNVVNIGRGKVEGLLIQSMQITSLGAGS